MTGGKRFAGVLADGEITVVALEPHGDTSATLTYRTGEGQLGERILNADDLAGITEVSQRRWTFDADGEMFLLASEARRMKWAHLADPFAAVDGQQTESDRAMEVQLRSFRWGLVALLTEVLVIVVALGDVAHG